MKKNHLGQLKLCEICIPRKDLLEECALNISVNTYMALFDLVKPEKIAGCLEAAQNVLVDSLRQRKGKVRLGVQVASLSSWVGDAVVEKFLLDDRFDAEVVITWQTNTDQKKEISQLVDHFSKKTINGYHIPFVIADGNHHPSDYDILFFTSPYAFAFANFWDREITLDTLICYVPYGFASCNIQATTLNLLVPIACWKFFVLTQHRKLVAQKYRSIGSFGMVYSGYPKLDPLLDPNCGKNCQWKIVGNPKKVRKIIYAPHHSINEMPFPLIVLAMIQFGLSSERLL